MDDEASRTLEGDDDKKFVGVLNQDPQHMGRPSQLEHGGGFAFGETLNVLNSAPGREPDLIKSDIYTNRGCNQGLYFLKRER